MVLLLLFSGSVAVGAVAGATGTDGGGVDGTGATAATGGVRLLTGVCEELHALCS